MNTVSEFESCYCPEIYMCDTTVRRYTGVRDIYIYVYRNMLSIYRNTICMTVI